MGDLAIVLIAGAAVLGAAVGSFLNVVIYRVPIGKSVVHPPSACPVCDECIRPADNVPVLSWLVLRGRCRNCRTRIPLRYPLIEAGTALAFAAVAWWLLTSLSPLVALSEDVDQAWLPLATSLLAVAYLWLAGTSIALTGIDLEHHRLPNVIVIPTYAVAIVTLGVPAVLAGDTVRLATAAAGAGVLFAFYFVLWLVWPGGMGMGDVKLAGVLGLYLGYSGWGALAVGAFGAFVLGGVFSIALLAMKRANRKSGIPFGPWMLGGAWIGIVVGDTLARAYLAVFGITAA